MQSDQGGGEGGKLLYGP